MHTLIATRHGHTNSLRFINVLMTHEHTRHRTADLHFLHGFSTSNQLSLIHTWMTAHCCHSDCLPVAKGGWEFWGLRMQLKPIRVQFLLRIREPAVLLQARTITTQERRIVSFISMWFNLLHFSANQSPPLRSSLQFTLLSGDVRGKKCIFEFLTILALLKSDKNIKTYVNIYKNEVVLKLVATTGVRSGLQSLTLWFRDLLLKYGTHLLNGSTCCFKTWIYL